MFKNFIKKIPAGNMMVPLILAALINTFVPSILHFGVFTEALFTNQGMKTLMGINLLAAGSQIRLSSVGEIFRRFSVIAIARIGAGLLIVFLVSSIFGREGIFGISILALVCACLNHNNSVFITLNIDYGDDLDQALAGFTSLITGPMLSMLVLGMSGIANIPLRAMIDALLPVCIGMVLGNIDRDISKSLKLAQKAIIPFLGFSMGSAINLTDIYRAGFSGIILAFIVIFVIGSLTVLADIYIGKRPGHAAWALSSTGANAVAVPQIIAEIDPTYLPLVGVATAQVASSAVITIILTPLITSLWARRRVNKN